MRVTRTEIHAIVERIGAEFRPEILNVYAVAVRYPGESADKSSAREAVRHATAVRSSAKRSLSLPA